MRKAREYGAEQAYIPLGPFKLRLPFIHYRWEWPEAAQGFILVAVALSASSTHMEALGCTFEVAITMVVLNGLLYILHPTLGDPVFPGWITPAIPLVLAYLTGFESGPDRIKATIALQLLMAFLFLVLGATGLAKKIMSFVPTSMRAGILMGAGIAATYSVLRPGEGGRMYGMEVAVIVGALLCFLIMYSARFASWRKKNKFCAFLSKYGMLPGLLVALILGTVLGELPPVNIEWGFTPLHFQELIANYTIFGVGIPDVSYFIKGLPMMVTAYIIAFGDFVLAETVVKEADEVRQDEYVEFNANRSNMISGLRNLILGIFAPYAPLNGPLWAGGTIAVAERYKHGREHMDSLYGGMGSYVIAMAIAGMLLPIVSLLKPALPIAMSLTMLVQGFACGYIAMNMVKTREEQGAAAITAIAVAFQSAAIGLAVGIVMHLILGVAKSKAAMAPVAAAESDAT